MRVKHFGFACRSEQDADRFYGDLLGLVKQEPKTIPASITGPLFGLDTSLLAVNYIGNELHLEAFITESRVEDAGRLSHVCLEVDDLQSLCERAVSLGFPVSRVPKGEGWVVFLDDRDGHRFEIKERIAGR